MQTSITAIFCHMHDLQCHLSLSEILTIALTASSYFTGNLEAARVFLPGCPI